MGVGRYVLTYASSLGAAFWDWAAMVVAAATTIANRASFNFMSGPSTRPNVDMTSECRCYIDSAFVAGRSVAGSAVQDWRSAIMGFTFDARQAGRYAAVRATNSNSPVAKISVTGSWGATPYRRLSIKRDTAYAKPPPSARPMATTPMVSRRIIETTRPDRAPSAMRIAISLVRLATPYDSTPYKPMAASASATDPNTTASCAVVRSCAVNGTISSLIEVTDTIGTFAATRSIVFLTAASTGVVSGAARIRKVGLCATAGGCSAATKKRGSTSPRRLEVRASPATPTT